MKKVQFQRFLTFMLSLTLTLSMAISVPIYAAGNADENKVGSTSEDVQNAGLADVASGEKVDSDEIESIILENTPVDSEGGMRQSEEMGISEGTSESVVVALSQQRTAAEDSEKDLQTDVPDPAAQMEATDGMASANDEQFDITPPKIEKVEFPQQGQTLKAGDTILLYIYAYDVDTVEGELSVSVALAPENSYSSTDMNISYDMENKRYECSYTLPDSAFEKIVVSYITVADKDHSVSENCYVYGDGYSGHKYWFLVEQNAVEPIHAKSFTLTQNGQVLDAGDGIEVSLETVEAVKEGYAVYAVFQNANGGECSVPLNSSDAERKTFSGSGQVSFYNDNGEYVLKRIYVNKGGLSGTQDFGIADIAACGFTVKKSEGDTSASLCPTIKSVSLDKNGEFLSAGDKVTVTVNTEVGEGATLSTSGSINFKASANITGQTQLVKLTLGKDGVYRGVFEITEDTYPCEWYVSSIGIRYTENSNYADYSAFTRSYPYYVNVKNGDTFVTPTRSVSVSFHALDETGNWETVQTNSLQIGWRQSLEECGVTLPEIETTYADFIHEGWFDSYGKEYIEGTPVLDIRDFSFYAKYDKKVATVNYRFVDETGEIVHKRRKISLPYNATYGDLWKSVESAAETESIYPGLAFQKWEVDNRNGNEDSAIIGINTSINADAVYDKNYISCAYEYVDIGGNWKATSRSLILEKDSTYAIALAEAQKYLPEDITKAYELEQWGSRVSEPDKTIPGFSSLTFTAKYVGKVSLRINQLYYDERGIRIYQGKPLVVDEKTTGDKIPELLNNWELPAFYPGLRFIKWDYYGSNLNADAILENGQVIAMNAQYGNCLFRYLIFHDEESLPSNDEEANNNCESIFCQVAEVGDTVTFPSTFEGYETVTWSMKYGTKLQPGDSFTAKQWITFYGYGSKMATKPEVPTEPEIPTEPETPTKPETPTEPENPTVGKELPNSMVEEVVDAILEAPEGMTVPVNMGGATVVSKEILEVAKGKDVNIQLNMNGYTWTINGKDIVAQDLKSVDLEVIMDTNHIPSKTLQALAGSNPLRQLSLVHEGSFGFKATLTVNMGAEYANQYGNLYYHDSAGKLVFIDAGKINSDGSVSLTFSHASDYVVVMSDRKMSQANVPSSLAPTPITSNTKNQSNNQSQTPKTGDASPIMVWMVCGMLALGTIVVVVKRRYTR